MSRPAVELVFFRGCPHVAQARANLAAALSAEGLLPEWTEWDLDDPGTPASRRRLPSPTILVGGVDVDPAPTHAGRACRASGASSVERLRRALAT